MSNKKPTPKQQLLSRELEVKELELQARYWKASYEVKNYFLLDKQMSDNQEYIDSISLFQENLIKGQENAIRELSESEALQVTAEPLNN